MSDRFRTGNGHDHDDWGRLHFGCPGCLRRVADDQRAAELLEGYNSQIGDVIDPEDVTFDVEPDELARLAASNVDLYVAATRCMYDDELAAYARAVVAIQTGAAA